jgi:hypothetical protein
MNRKLVAQEIQPFYQGAVQGKVTDIIAALTKLVETHGTEVRIAERTRTGVDGTRFAVVVDRPETNEEFAARAAVKAARDAKALQKYNRLQNRLQRAGVI